MLVSASVSPGGIPVELLKKFEDVRTAAPLLGTRLLTCSNRAVGLLPLLQRRRQIGQRRLGSRKVEMRSSSDSNHKHKRDVLAPDLDLDLG